MKNDKTKKKQKVKEKRSQQPAAIAAPSVVVDLDDGSLTLKDQEIEYKEFIIDIDNAIDEIEKFDKAEVCSPPLSSSEDEKKAMDAYNELMEEEKEMLAVQRILNVNRKIDIHIEKKIIEKQIEQEDDPDMGIDFSELMPADVVAIIIRKLGLNDDTVSMSTSSMSISSAASFTATSVASITLKALNRLQELTTVKRENRIAVGENNGCSILLSVLQMYVNFTTTNNNLINDIIESACMVVANLAYNNNNKSKMGKIGMCEFLMELLEKYMKTASVVKMGCWAIINLAVSHPENVNRFYICNGMNVLIKVMNLHFSDVGIIQWGCLGVAYLATKKENTISAREAGICELLLRIFDSYSENIGITEEVCRAVGAIAYEDELSRTRYSTIGGGLERLLQCIDRYISNAEIMYWICMALVNLCRENDENKIKLGSLGAIVYVNNILEHHFANYALVDQCIWVLQMLVSTQGNAEEIGRTACQMIVKVMVSYYDQHGIIERSSKILAYLTTIGTTRCAENIKLIRETESGLEIILIAIKAYYNSNLSTTLYWLIVLLNNMCNDENTESQVVLTGIGASGLFVKLNDLNKNIFHALQGFNVVLDTLEYNIDDATLTEEVCKSLNNLIGEYDINRCEESWLKSYPILLLVISKHAHNVPICYLALRALFNIIMSIRDLVDTKQGVIGLLQILKIHSDSTIVLWTCKVMNSMGMRSGSASWSALGAEGACEVILDILRKHHEDTEIAEHSCWLFHSLAIDDGNSALLVGESNEGCQLLVRILGLHIFSANVVERVCCAINNISFNNQASSTVLGAMGALKLIISSLKIHQESPDVSYWCCSAVNNLVCDNKSNLKIVGNIGGCEAIIEMLKRYLTHCAVAEQACVAIQNLSFFAANKKRFLDYHVIEVLKSALKVHGSGKEDAKHVDIDKKLVSDIGPEIIKTLEVFAADNEKEKYCYTPFTLRDFLNFGCKILDTGRGKKHNKR